MLGAIFLRNPPWYFDSMSLVWLSICSYKLHSNGSDKSYYNLTYYDGIFVICIRYISIFQLIGEYFGVLIWFDFFYISRQTNTS